MAERLCEFDGCSAPHYGKGFCQSHYLKWRRYGHPHGFRGPSEVVISGNSARVVLSNRMTVIVDAADVPIVKGSRWMLAGGYAQRTIRKKDGSRSAQKMHRVLLNAPPDKIVDHINGNGLDNRRCNLRLCDAAQNTQNRPGNADAKSPYKGVYPFNNKWCAKIVAHGQKHYLGTFLKEEDAARAYRNEAVRLHGDFAWSEV